MASKAKTAPRGYHTVTPYLTVDGADRAIAFYKEAFDATEVMRMPGPNGRVGHAEIRIGDSPIMLSDEYPDMGARGPHSLGGTPVTIHLYVADVDATAGRAIAAGAKELRPVKDQFYGDRTGSVTDPFGHIWHIATHKVDVPPDELRKRAEEMAKQHAS